MTGTSATEMDTSPMEIEGSLDEYRGRGAYHENHTMARDWVPIYHRRFFAAENYLKEQLCPDAKILDVGCGEGVFLNLLREAGFRNVFGIEPFAPVKDKEIKRGNIYELPAASETYDAVTCFDVLEHLPLNRQGDAAAELFRVCRPGAIAVITVPNMAHLRSRIQFLIRGRPWRNKLTKHPGELTIHERLDVLCGAGFSFISSLGFHLTLCKDPCPSGVLGRMVSRFMFHSKAPAGLCAEVMLVVCKPPVSSSVRETGGSKQLRRIAGKYVPPEDDPTAVAYRSSK